MKFSGLTETVRRTEIKEITKKTENKNDSFIFQYKDHPGYGESSYHKMNDHQIYHESDLLTFALVGNQNCGKTTLFNQLTGSNQHVGNFPGVTVDRKDGVIKGYKNTLITIYQVFIQCHLIVVKKSSQETSY